MGAIFSLLGSNVKVYLIAIGIAVVFAVGGTFTWKYKSALESLKETQEQNVQLEKEKTALSQVNQQNQAFIADLQADLAKKEQIVNDFRIQKARDDKKLSDLSKVIISYDKKDDGPIAKVLKDAVEGILKFRDGKEGEQK
jgi:predicted membrane protein